MKRVFLISIVLLMACNFALAEPMSYLDYTDDILEDGSLLYSFPEMSLQLPADWNGKVIALREDQLTSFYHKASYEKYNAEGQKGGLLFSLGVSVNGSFSQLPAFEYLGFSEESSLNYYLAFPTDAQAYHEAALLDEYAALYAEVDYVTEHAHFYFEQSAIESAPAGDDTSAVTLGRVRYHFEHSALPRYFYDDPANMIDVLRTTGTYQIWKSLADENGVAYPYTADDYAEHVYEMDDGAILLQVLMPQPSTPPECYRAYMVFNPHTGNAAYYTIEYENLLGEAAMTCGWTEDLTHVTYGGAAILNMDASDYEEQLWAEAQQIASLAGISQTPVNGADTVPEKKADINTTGLAEIPCPELGFTTMADPSFPWEYQDGTGIVIYTKTPGSIPYVIVWQSEDLIAEPFEYICEQYTPHVKNQYGDDLVYYQEYEEYSLGGKQLPAGVYNYRLNGTMIDLIRVYDSTGKRTVAFTAKYIQGEAEPTLSALHDAIRYFKATD